MEFAFLLNRHKLFMMRRRRLLGRGNSCCRVEENFSIYRLFAKFMLQHMELAKEFNE